MRVEVDADTETPVSAFLKLAHGQRQAFLLESVEGGERSARFSFLGAGPRSTLRWKLGERPQVSGAKETPSCEHPAGGRAVDPGLEEGTTHGRTRLFTLTEGLAQGSPA